MRRGRGMIVPAGVMRETGVLGIAGVVGRRQRMTGLLVARVMGLTGVLRKTGLLVAGVRRHGRLTGVMRLTGMTGLLVTGLGPVAGEVGDDVQDVDKRVQAVRFASVEIHVSGARRGGDRHDCRKNKSNALLHYTFLLGLSSCRFKKLFVLLRLVYPKPVPAQ